MFQNALHLTLPASGIALRDKLQDFFQISGHPDGLTLANPNTVWKRFNGADNTEHLVYKQLCQDEQINFVPQYYGDVSHEGQNFIEMENLLYGFNNPHLIDIKLGTRTFRESEVKNTTARRDLYEKMIAVEPNAPTKNEHELKAVTKLRYMQFRECQSSTCIHGFRIEAMKLAGSPTITDFKRVRDHETVVDTMRLFFNDGKHLQNKLLERLIDIRERIENSNYFQTHEVIGSSIFIVYDEEKIGAWLIDFAKTYQVPDGVRLTHRDAWVPGNREEGILLGLDNLITTIQEIS